MRKLIAAPFLTLDGYVAGANGDMSWNIDVFNDEMGQWITNLYENSDTIVLGRVTYQEFLGFWPGADNDADPMAKTMNTTPKIVFSTTLDDVEWGTYDKPTLIRDNVVDQVNKLKAQDGKNMVIVGSARLVQSLLNLGVIDELHLMIHPTIVGDGKCLYENISKKIQLDLAKSDTFKNGVVTLEYKVKG